MAREQLNRRSIDTVRQPA